MSFKLSLSPNIVSYYQSQKKACIEIEKEAEFV